MEELDAEELRENARVAGCVPVASCTDRTRVTIRGTISSVTLQPRAGAAELTAELYDGTGTVTLLWTGRHRIAGIEPGRQLVAEGRISRHEDKYVIYNPRYTLLAGHRS